MNETCKKHVDSCRFCWMCRHICPIGNATGLERNNARARALGLSLVNRGTYDLSEVIDNIYECAECGACTKECATGWDPVMFIEAAKLDAALAGKTPAYILPLVQNAISTGNTYGKTEVCDELKTAIAPHAGKTNLLFLLGVDARFGLPEAGVKALKAMEKTGVAFTALENEPAVGSELAYLIGKMEETKVQMTAAAGVLDGYKEVVVFDPRDALTLKRKLGEYGVELKTKVTTFTAFLAALLEEGRLKPVKRAEKAVYQDPFELARDLGETEEPRKVISAYRELGEMLMHGKDTMWAGNLLMKNWMPDAILGAAKNRLQNVKGIGADTVITASVSEYASLKAVMQNDVRILSIEELILGE